MIMIQLPYFDKIRFRGLKIRFRGLKNNSYVIMFVIYSMNTNIHSTL